MLKSTYQAVPAQTPGAPKALPPGWTEHKAPTGHTYYYNAETKQSTYTRPTVEAEIEDLQIDYNATAPDQVVQASIRALDDFHKNNPDVKRCQGQGQGHFTGGKSYQDRTRRNQRQDRPKSKASIPNCEPWILVKTKFGRRFVHNTETKDSFWKLPQDVMMAVIEMDRMEWEAKKRKDEQKTVQSEQEKPVEVSAGNVPSLQQTHDPDEEGYDSDEYEEVEVTDDEDETASKRMRFEPNEQDSVPKPVEFDEDDIAWQLAQMEEDDYSEEGFEEDAGEDEEGLPLTAEDSQALFRSLLDESRIDPYSTFDALIEYNNAAIIDDPRWISLPNMSSRRTAFTNWSRDRIAEIKEREASTAATKKKKDPRVAYLNFLSDNATPKLYWPEFKRKFKKEPEMKDLSFSDKDREKLYREYISKLKLSESDRKREFREILKGLSRGDSWNRDTQLDDLPDTLIRDLKFYLIRDRKARDELVIAQIESL